MSLLSPLVVGPLSECSRSVRVQGQLTGSRVKIYSGGRPVAEGVATWSDDVFPLIPGESLKPGEEVAATQDDGSGPSPMTPAPLVKVQAKAAPGPLSVLAPPYGCGQAVWIKGAVPGATITAKEGVNTLGSGDAPDGGARLFLSPPISSGGVLLANQVACGAASGDTPFPPAPAPPAALPVPVVGEPLRDCERSIRISNVLVGALVTVDRSGGPSQSSYFDYPILNFINISPPLKKGEAVTARQEFPVCQLRSPESKPVTVGPNTPIPIPRILGPVCAASAAVKIGNLTPGNRVRILADKVEIGVAEAPAAIFTFPLPPLKGGETLTAQQNLCGAWSGDSNAVVVQAAGSTPPVIAEPIFACGGAVHATAPAGSWVILYSTLLGGEIGRTFASETGAWDVDIPVAPLLIAGDSIFPLTFGCSAQKGKIAVVQPSPQELNAPRIGAVMQLISVVPVTSVVPGARVDILVNGLWRGSDFCSRSFGQIAISGTLLVGDQVAARQSLCTMISPPTVPPVIVEAPPVAAFTASPTSGEVPLTVKFTSTSTGKITGFAWDFDNNGSVDSMSPNAANTYRAVGSFTAKLTVTGPGGKSSATAAIQVMPVAVGFDQIAVFNCDTDFGSINVWTRDATAGGAWIDHGELDAQYDGSGFCPVGTPKVVALTDKHAFEVACVDTDLIDCPGNDPTQLSCRRFYTVVAGKKGGGTFTITTS